MDHETVKVRPNQVRFSQDSIADHFKLGHGKEFLLRDALNDLRSNRLKASDFPLIEVAKDENGLLWSNDNRRLWLFRKARISIIEINLYSRPLFRAPPESHLRGKMGSQAYFPRVRIRRVKAQRNSPVMVEKEEKRAVVYPSASEKEQRAPPVFSGREEVRRRGPPEMPGFGKMLITVGLTVLIWGVLILIWGVLKLILGVRKLFVWILRQLK